MRGDQRLLRIVDSGRCIAVKDSAVILLELCDVACTRLPCCRSSKQDCIPILEKEAFAIVVPNRVQHAGAACGLPVRDKSLDITQGHIEVWPYAVPVIHARGHPRFHTGLRIRIEPSLKTLRLGIVLPRDGDHVVGKPRNERGAVHRHIAPEEQSAMQWRKRLVNP